MKQRTCSNKHSHSIRTTLKHTGNLRWCGPSNGCNGESLSNPIAHSPSPSAQAALGRSQDSNANWVMGYVLLNERRWDEARPYYDAAVRLESKQRKAHATFANFNVLTGRPADAVKLAERALHLNPQPPSWCYWAQGFALVANGQFDDAIRTLRRPEVYRTVARRVSGGCPRSVWPTRRGRPGSSLLSQQLSCLAHFDLDGDPAVSAQPRRSVLGEGIQACRSTRLTLSFGRVDPAWPVICRI